MAKSLVRALVNMKLDYEHAKYANQVMKECKRRPLSAKDEPRGARQENKNSDWNPYKPIFKDFFPLYLIFYHDKGWRKLTTDELSSTSGQTIPILIPGVQPSPPLRLRAGVGEEDDPYVITIWKSDKKLKRKINKKRFAFRR